MSETAHPLWTWSQANALAAPGSWRARCTWLGLWLLRIGIGAMLIGVFLTPPWGKFGIALAILGAVLSRPPIFSMLAAWVGLLLAAWIALSFAAGWLRGAAGYDSAAKVFAAFPAMLYVWLAIPLGAAVGCDARWRRWALRALIAVAAAALLLGLLQFFIGLGKGGLKIDSSGVRFKLSNGFSAVHLHFGFAGALLAALAMPGSGLGMGAGWNWLARGVALAVLTICGARVGLVGGVAAIASALSARGGRWLVGGVIIAMVLGGVVAARFALTDSSRLTSIVQGSDGRFPIWKVTVATIAEHPWLGFGTREAWKISYLQRYPEIAPNAPNEFAPDAAPHPHQWQLTATVDHGIPAALLHLLLVAAVVAFLWQRRRQQPAAFQAGLGVAVAGVVCGLFEPLPVLAAAGAGFHAALGLCCGAALVPRDDVPPATSA